MPGSYILALDQGTTSSRAMLVDATGQVAAVVQREFHQIYPQPGWVEHDPAEIWASQHGAMWDVMEAAGVGAAHVAAIGLANQRETAMIWDRASGKPLANAIVWQDRRTADFCRELKEQGHEPMVTAKTGLRLDPYFSATKLRWLLDHTPGARQMAAQGRLAAGTIDSWLLWNLTGGKAHATDPSNAARTMLFDIRRGEWDEELLELFGIPRTVLAEVRDSSGVVATAVDGPVIAGVAGDQQAALFGQACFSPGMAKNTYGTGCFLLMNTGWDMPTSSNNLLATIAWRLRGETTYALEGSVFAAGAVVQWLRDELGMVSDAAETERLARTVADSGGLVLVPAFAGLGAPWWDPYARGLVIGLTRGVTRGHFCRAALESIAFQSAELLHCMARDSGTPAAELRVDGGATRNDLLMQIQADLAGVPVVRPSNVEATALGAAFLAGLGTGFWQDLTELAALRRDGSRFVPQAAPADTAVRWRAWRRAVERARGWAADEETDSA